MENMEVFAWSFNARPIMLAMPSDTAIKWKGRQSIRRIFRYLGIKGKRSGNIRDNAHNKQVDKRRDIGQCNTKI